LFPSFSAIPLKQAYDDKGLETYITLVKELAGWLDKILTANKKLYIKYIANIRISAADFAVASLLFTYIYNDSFGGGPTFYEKGKEII
jgi:glutathione S-transferase